jgi:hypothetical protein
MVLVYLVLNHWIELAKARLGRPRCRAEYRDMYPLLQSLSQGGAVVVPLSEVHYSEMRDRIASVEQRSDLAITMAELSFYNTLPPREILLAVQLRRALARHFGVPDVQEADVPVVGYGVGFARRAIPLQGALTGGQDTVSDPTGKLAEALEAVEARVGGGWRYSRRGHLAEQDWRSALSALFLEAAEFMILRGPQPSDMDHLRTLGYRPEELAQVMVEASERDQRMKAALMAKPLGERRPDDVAGAAALVVDSSLGLVSKALAALGLAYKLWGSLSKDDMIAVVANVPILDVEAALRRARLRNGDYHIEINDIYDMAALGVAASCCNVIATDSSARHMLAEAGVPERWGCQLVSAASDLLTVVRNLAA